MNADEIRKAFIDGSKYGVFVNDSDCLEVFSSEREAKDMAAMNDTHIIYLRISGGLQWYDSFK